MKKTDFLFLPRISFASDVDGFLSEREGWLLFLLARNTIKSTDIVEIGSWQGKSTIWIAKGSQQGNKNRVFAIDPHIGSSEHQKDGKIWTFDIFKKNITESLVNNIVTPVIKTSRKAKEKINGEIGFLFIDGAHEYKFVSLDYNLWSPSVVDGGWIAFHDLQWPGVGMTIREMLKRKRIKNVFFTDTIFCGQRSRQISSWDNLKNHLMFWVALSFAQVNKANIPKMLKIRLKDLLKLSRIVIFLL